MAGRIKKGLMQNPEIPQYMVQICLMAMPYFVEPPYFTTALMIHTCRFSHAKEFGGCYSFWNL